MRDKEEDDSQTQLTTGKLIQLNKDIVDQELPTAHDPDLTADAKQEAHDAGFKIYNELKGDVKSIDPGTTDAEKIESYVTKFMPTMIQKV